MRFDIITIFPDETKAMLAFGVIGRAINAGLIELHVWNPRDYTTDRHRTVDDRPYGGGPGMVMKPEPLVAAIAAAKEASPDASVVYMSPQGQTFTQHIANEWMADVDGGSVRNVVLLCGRYEGVDERVLERYVDIEWSIGDVVLSGGEFAAAIVLDTLSRLVPGVLGAADSAIEDSFMNGLLDCPHYTRPVEFEGMNVPTVLQSGDHAKIAAWRRQQSLVRTAKRRPDLLTEDALSEAERDWLQSSGLDES